MNIEIKENFLLEVYGCGGVVTGRDYSGTAFKLSGKVWEIIKSNKINSKGINIWIYESGGRIFTGVELLNHSEENSFGLEKKIVNLNKYAYYKHIGSYRLIKQIGEEMTSQIIKQGLEVISPYIEIYGHWNSDETKSETELLMCLK